MTKNKKIKNKLVISISILVVILFIGTSMTTAVARISLEELTTEQQYYLGVAEEPDSVALEVAEEIEKTVVEYEEHILKVETQEINENAVPEQTVEVEENAASEQTTGIEEKEIIPDDPKDDCNYYYWFDKAIIENGGNCKYSQKCGCFMYEDLRTFNTKSECEISLLKAKLSAEDKEVIISEKQIKPITSELSVESISDCPLCSAKVLEENNIPKDVSLNDVLTDEQAIQVATILVLASEAAPVLESYQRLNSGQKMLVRQQSISELDEYIDRVDDEEQKQNLQIVKALALKDYSKVEQLQKHASVKDSTNDLVISSAMPMPRASATYVSTSSSVGGNPCINGQRLATNSEATECQERIWGDITSGLGTLGYGAFVLGRKLVGGIWNLGVGTARLILAGISQLDHPGLFVLAMGLVFGPSLATGLATLFTIAVSVITAILSFAPQALGLLILGGLGLDAAIEAHCKRKDCDDGNRFTTGSLGSSMQAQATYVSVATFSASTSTAASTVLNSMSTNQ